MIKRLNKPNKALPAFEIVKKDILDSRREANKWLSVYNIYSGAGYNQKTMELYLNRFSAEVLRLYYQLEPKLDSWEDFNDLIGFNPKPEMSYEEWVSFFRRLNKFIEASGISDIGMPQIAMGEREV